MSREDFTEDFTDESEIQPGDWVQVWGQVQPIDCHPEDVVVEFFSHSDQYQASVRRDRVEAPAEPPPFLTLCTSLYGTLSGYLWRCALREHGPHVQHSANGGSLHWGDDKAVGHIEERSR